MSDVGNPKPAEYQGVSVEDRRIRDYVRQCAKNGFTKEHAQKIVGMPREVIDRYYKEEGK